jgi:hypothetical protein
MTDLLKDWLFKHGGEIGGKGDTVTGYDGKAHVWFSGVKYDPAGTLKDLEEAIKNRDAEPPTPEDKKEK